MYMIPTCCVPKLPAQQEETVLETRNIMIDEGDTPLVARKQSLSGAGSKLRLAEAEPGGGAMCLVGREEPPRRSRTSLWAAEVARPTRASGGGG